jgi:hypothetical protein
MSAFNHHPTPPPKGVHGYEAILYFLGGSEYIVAGGWLRDATDRASRSAG